MRGGCWPWTASSGRPCSPSSATSTCSARWMSTGSAPSRPRLRSAGSGWRLRRLLSSCPPRRQPVTGRRRSLAHRLRRPPRRRRHPARLPHRLPPPGQFAELEQSLPNDSDFHQAHRPKVLAETSVLLTDPAGRVLLLHPTSARDQEWRLPGSGIDSDAGKGPREAARRILRDQLHLDLPPDNCWPWTGSTAHPASAAPSTPSTGPPSANTTSPASASTPASTPSGAWPDPPLLPIMLVKVRHEVPCPACGPGLYLAPLAGG